MIYSVLGFAAQSDRFQNPTPDPCFMKDKWFLYKVHRIPTMVGMRPPFMPVERDHRRSRRAIAPPFHPQSLDSIPVSGTNSLRCGQ